MVFCCNKNIFSPDINNFPYHFPWKFSIEIGIIQLPTFGNIPHGSQILPRRECLCLWCSCGWIMIDGVTLMLWRCSRYLRSTARLCAWEYWHLGNITSIYCICWLLLHFTLFTNNLNYSAYKFGQWWWIMFPLHRNSRQFAINSMRIQEAGAGQLCRPTL